MSSEDNQREILIRMVEQIDITKLTNSQLRKIINVTIEEEKKPVATIKSDNFQTIAEDCLKKTRDAINNNEISKIIPLTPYDEDKWKPLWSAELKN